MTRLIRLEGFQVSFQRVYRIWKSEGLKVRQERKKKRAQGNSKNACHRLRAERINHVWSWDFIFYRTTSGHSLKWLSIVDEYTRRCITLDVGQSMASEDVINHLAELFAMYGVPECIRSDNGPEFVAKAIQQWLSLLEIKTLYVAPASPWKNGYAGSFHSRLRDELLNIEEFDSARHARAHAARSRPCGSLAGGL